MVTPLRIVFFGTPAFAVPSLDALIAAAPHLVVGVVTQPDRPRGRGQRVSDAPVKARAIDASLPILQPDRIKEPGFVDRLAAWQPDLGVVAAYGRILTEEILATPRLGMINVHASLLPKYRGAAPIHRAVIEGNAFTGVTIMRVVKALDAGPMLADTRRPIGANETSEDVEQGLAQIGAELLVRTIDRLWRGEAGETPQDDAAATYAPRITRDDGAVDWRWTAARIHNLVRGLHPWPHAFTYIGGKRLILIASQLTDDARLPAVDVEAGTVVEASGDRLIVAAGGGTLALTQVQVEGKRPMTTREFLSGHSVTPGARLTSTP